MDSALGDETGKNTKKPCLPARPFSPSCGSLVSRPFAQTCEGGGVNGSGYSGGALLLAGNTDVTLTDFGFRDNLALKVRVSYLYIYSWFRDA
jgi:hypothetical protein